MKDSVRSLTLRIYCRRTTASVGTVGIFITLRNVPSNNQYHRRTTRTRYISHGFSIASVPVMRGSQQWSVPG